METTECLSRSKIAHIKHNEEVSSNQKSCWKNAFAISKITMYEYNLISMENKNKQHLLKLKEIYQKRLHILEEKAAKYGDLDVPAYIVIEIEEIKAKIIDTNAQLSIWRNIARQSEIESRDNLSSLHYKLSTHFNLEELRTLCFNLSIDCENFPLGKEGLTRELISYSLRQGSISELINYCKEKRPNISW